MTIIPRAQVAAAVIRAVMLGATDEEAIATVAQALHLSIEAVAECLKAERVEA